MNPPIQKIENTPKSLKTYVKYREIINNKSTIKKVDKYFLAMYFLDFIIFNINKKYISLINCSYI